MTSFNFDGKKARTVGLTCRYHMSNKMRGSIFQESTGLGLTCFLLFLLCFFLFFALFFFFCLVLFCLFCCYSCFVLFCFFYCTVHLFSLEWKRWNQFYHNNANGFNGIWKVKHMSEISDFQRGVPMSEYVVLFLITNVAFLFNKAYSTVPFPKGWETHFAIWDFYVVRSKAAFNYSSRASKEIMSIITAFYLIIKIFREKIFKKILIIFLQNIFWISPKYNSTEPYSKG